MIPVEALHAGDRTRFRELIEQHGGLVMSVVESYATDQDDVEDLFQGVWVTVWTKRKQYRGGSWVRWLLTLARNHCASRQRAEQSHVARMERLALESDEEEHGWKAEDPHGVIEERESHTLLYEALGLLSDREHEAVCLRILEGKSPEEVARAMGVKKVTVRSLVRRGINRLQEIMEVEPEKETNGANGG